MQKKIKIISLGLIFFTSLLLTEDDEIIVLDKGQIIEVGTHEMLLKENGTYSDLWRVQAGLQRHEPHNL